MNIEIQVKTAGAEIRLTIPTDAQNAPGLLAAALEALHGREAQEGQGVQTQTDRQVPAVQTQTPAGEPGEVTEEMKRYARAEVERARRRWKKDAQNHENHGVIHEITGEIGVIEREDLNLKLIKPILPFSMKSQARRVRKPEQTQDLADDQLVIPLDYQLPERLRTPAIAGAWEEYLRKRRQRTAWQRIRWGDLQRMFGTLETAHEMAGEPGVLEVLKHATEKGLNCAFKVPESVEAPKAPTREDRWRAAGYTGNAWDLAGNPPKYWLDENPAVKEAFERSRQA